MLAEMVGEAASRRCPTDWLNPAPNRSYATKKPLRTGAALMMAEHLLDPPSQGGQDLQLSVVKLSGPAVDQTE